MKVRVAIPGLLGCAVLLAAGCGSPEAPKSPYCVTPACNSPIGVMGNLTKAISLKNLGETLTLLDSSFVYRFIPNSETGARDSLSYAEVVSDLKQLYSGVLPSRSQPAIAAFSLALDTTASAPDNRPGHSRWIRYRVETHFEQRYASGEIDVVNSPADLYFRISPDGIWKLVEWQDMASTSRPEVRAADPNQVPWARRTPQAGN